jgi:hypothetical protein
LEPSIHEWSVCVRLQEAVVKPELKEEWQEAWDIFVKALTWVLMFPLGLFGKFFPSGDEEQGEPKRPRK